MGYRICQKKIEPALHHDRDKRSIVRKRPPGLYKYIHIATLNISNKPISLVLREKKSKKYCFITDMNMYSAYG